MALDDAERLRLYLGERIPATGTAADTFFSDDEIDELLTSSPTGEVNGAAVIGWAAKAGEYARLIDLNESGGVRNLSQRYRQALSQTKMYQDLADRALAARTASGRFVGKSINWSSAGDQGPIVLYTRHYNRMPILDPFGVTDRTVIEVQESYHDQP